MATVFKFRNAIMAMLIIMMGVAVAACGSKDDNEPKNEGEGEKPSTEGVEVTDQGNGVLAADGQTFSITSFSDNTAEVTGTTWDVNKETFTGGFVIPAYIKYQGKRYSVTSIGTRAFSKFEKMTSVKLPATLVTIGDEAFFRCTSLSSIVIPDKVTIIGEEAFMWCKFTSVTFSKSLKTIGRAAFEDCTNLVSVEIPNSVTVIERGAFFECESLKKVTLSKNLITIGEYAFGRCPLTSIELPNTLIEIGEEAFYNTDLTSVIIPDKITTIKRSAFYGCYKLSEITLPKSIESIEHGAFYVENYKDEENEELIEGSLTKIIINATVPPQLVYMAFSEEAYNNVTLVVPSASYQKYKDAENWSNFKHIEKGN